MSERRIQYTRSINYSKQFSFGEIQHNIRWDKFTPLSPTKGQLSYQHWKSEIISHIRHFKSWLRLIPISQRSPSKPEGHKHWYPLAVNPDWQVALFSQWEFSSQAFLRRKHKIKWNNERKMEGSNERRNLIPNYRIHENLCKHLLLLLYYSKSTISKHQFVTHLRATIIKTDIRCQVTVIF